MDLYERANVLAILLAATNAVHAVDGKSNCLNGDLTAPAPHLSEDLFECMSVRKLPFPISGRNVWPEPFV